MERARLLEAYRHLTVAVRASESWQPSYKKDRKSFSALLELEAQLVTAVGEYLRGLSERAPGYIDWSVYYTQVKAAASPVANQDEPEWDFEDAALSAAVMDIIIAMTMTGASAGQAICGIDVGVNALNESILSAARTQVANLVKGVTNTTRNLIRESIRTSVDMGEDLNSATARLVNLLNDPARAELIAYTESVRAYQNGLLHFATQTGAKTKTWEALAGACRICSPLNGKTVPIDSSFDGIDGPPGHPRCRCGVYYQY